MTNNNATKQDIQDLEVNLNKQIKDTETRLDKNFTDRLNKSLEAFRIELQYQFKLQDERWDRRFTTFESKIYTLIDPLLKEIETRQQDREITTAQIKDLDTRVTKLENA